MTIRLRNLRPQLTIYAKRCIELGVIRSALDRSARLHQHTAVIRLNGSQADSQPHESRETFSQH